MSDPPVMSRRRKEHGRRAESRAARRLGGTANPGSGAVEGLKGDVTLDEILLESKSTVGVSIPLRKEWLDKISREAAAVGKYPGLIAQFVDRHGRPVDGGSWVVIPEYVFRELVD